MPEPIEVGTDYTDATGRVWHKYHHDAAIGRHWWSPAGPGWVTWEEIPLQPRDALQDRLVEIDHWGARGLGPSRRTVERMMPEIDAYVAARLAEAAAD